MTDVFHSDWSHAGIKKEYNWMNEFSSPITTFVDHYYISTINYYLKSKAEKFCSYCYILVSDNFLCFVLFELREL